MFIEKLPYFLPEHVMHYNKTGELDDGVRNDIAVFKCRDFAWCAAFLTDQKEIPAYEADRIIAEFSLKLYRVLAESYNF